MTKTPVSNLSSACIIYRASDPSQIFCEIKDDGHPVKLVRRQLCLIGGNWVGEDAASDRDPRQTLEREIRAELTFERPLRNSIELSLLGLSAIKRFQSSPAPATAVTEHDRELIEHLKQVIVENALYFATYLDTVSKAALDSADSKNTRGGFTSLDFYFTSALEEADWQSLVALQKNFGNLSNESVTIVTSLDEILTTGTNIAFGQHGALKQFWRNNGLALVEQVSLTTGVESEVVNHSELGEYARYLEHYEVAKKPI